MSALGKERAWSWDSEQLATRSLHSRQCVFPGPARKTPVTDHRPFDLKAVPPAADRAQFGFYAEVTEHRGERRDAEGGRLSLRPIISYAGEEIHMLV